MNSSGWTRGQSGFGADRSEDSITPSQIAGPQLATSLAGHRSAHPLSTMPEYRYALHDFLPEHEDEISFRAGDRIEVIEKDDQYSDGWWQVSSFTLMLLGPVSGTHIPTASQALSSTLVANAGVLARSAMCCRQVTGLRHRVSLSLAMSC